MPSGKTLKAGKAVLTLSLDDRVAKGLKELQGKLKSIGAGISGVGRKLAAAGGVISGAFGGAVTIFAKVGDNLDKMSNRTGISAELLSALGFASQQSGQSIEVLEKSLSRMQRTLYDAGRGLATPNDALADLGFKIEDLEGLDPDKQFTMLAEAISKVEDPTTKAGIAVSIFGQAGRKMIPLLDGGAAGIAAFVAEAESLGIVMSQDDVTAAAALTDALNRFWRQVQQIAITIGAAVAGPLMQFLAITKTILAPIIQWISANRGLVTTIAAIGVGLLAAGTALVVLGGSISLMGVAVGGLASIFGVLSAIVAALVSPLGLVVAAVAGAATWFATATETGQALVDTLGGKFGELWEIASKTFQGIAALLAAGQIEAAATLLWSGLTLIWLKATAGLRERWHEFTGSITKVWHTTVAGLATLMTEAWAVIRNVWDTSTTAIANTWDQFISGIKIAWNSVVAFFKTTWLKIKGLFGADVADEIRAINAELQIANDEIAVQLGERQAGRSEASQARNAGRSQDAAAIVDQIGADLAAKLSRDDSATQRKIAASEKALADAREAWQNASVAGDEAIAAAAKQTKAKELEQQSDGPAGLASTVEGAKGAAILDATFAAQQFGGRSEEIQLLERIADATEKFEEKDLSQDVTTE